MAATHLEFDVLSIARARNAERQRESSTSRVDRIAAGLNQYAKRPVQRRRAPVSVPAGSAPAKEADRD